MSNRGCPPTDAENFDGESDENVTIEVFDRENYEATRDEIEMVESFGLYPDECDRLFVDRMSELQRAGVVNGHPRFLDEFDTAVDAMFRRLDPKSHAFADWMGIKGYVLAWFGPDYEDGRYLNPPCYVAEPDGRRLYRFVDRHDFVDEHPEFFRERLREIEEGQGYIDTGWDTRAAPRFDRIPGASRIKHF